MVERGENGAKRPKSKDFQSWHEQKKKIHDEKARPFFRIGEIWFCAFGLNVGFEQDGRGATFLRPVIVLRKFNNDVLWVVPLTKNQKTGPYYFSFAYANEVLSTAILSQIRLIDAKRLMYRTGTMSGTEFGVLKTRMRDLLK